MTVLQIIGGVIGTLLIPVLWLLSLIERWEIFKQDGAGPSWAKEI